MIHNSNAAVLVLIQTLFQQVTFESKHYHTKTICCWNKIVKLGIRLLKISITERFGIYLPTDYLHQVEHWNYQKEIDGTVTLFSLTLKWEYWWSLASYPLGDHFCFKLFKGKKYWKSSIQPRLKWYLIPAYSLE